MWSSCTSIPLFRTSQLHLSCHCAQRPTRTFVVLPRRMVILGAALTAVNKPMYAASGAVATLAGTTACLWWDTFAKVRIGSGAGWLHSQGKGGGG